MILQRIKKDIESYLKLEDIETDYRGQNYFRARCLFFTVAKEATTYSLESIGKEVNRNHATVIHGLSQFELIKKLYPYYTVYIKMINKYKDLKLTDEEKSKIFVLQDEIKIHKNDIKHLEIENKELQETIDDLKKEYRTLESLKIIFNGNLNTFNTLDPYTQKNLLERFKTIIEMESRKVFNYRENENKVAY